MWSDDTCGIKTNLAQYCDEVKGNWDGTTYACMLVISLTCKHLYGWICSKTLDLQLWSVKFEVTFYEKILGKLGVGS